MSAGFDACHGHTSALGGYELTPDIFGHFTSTLLKVHALGKVVCSFMIKSSKEKNQQMHLIRYIFAPPGAVPRRRLRGEVPRRGRGAVRARPAVPQRALI